MHEAFFALRMPYRLTVALICLAVNERMSAQSAVELK